MSAPKLTKPSVSAESWIEIIPAPSGKRLDRPRGVTVISSFEVPPAREEVWTETWQALGDIAISRPECRGFQILRDRNDLTRFLVLSEWPDVDSFHRFVRETSLLWLDRVIPGLCIGSEYTILERISDHQKSERDAGEC